MAERSAAPMAKSGAVAPNGEAVPGYAALTGLRLRPFSVHGPDLPVGFTWGKSTITRAARTAGQSAGGQFCFDDSQLAT